MSTTQTAREYVEEIKPMPGETLEALASRMFSVQMEIYSAYAMCDLWLPFEFLDKKTQKLWFTQAKLKLRNYHA